MIYDERCNKLTTEFNMKSSGTDVYTSKLQAKCAKMRWHMGTQQIINFINTAGSTINIVHQSRLMWPHSRPNLRPSARALEPCSKQESGRTTQ
jgi:hypothetical protein